MRALNTRTLCCCCPNPSQQRRGKGKQTMQLRENLERVQAKRNKLTKHHPPGLKVKVTN